MPLSATKVDPGRRTSAEIVDALRPAPTARGECLIAMTDVVKAYGSGRPILNGISLSVHEGETVALIGPNGAGKSTLLKTLIGLNEANAGSLTVFGEALSRRDGRRQKARLRQQIGFVFQHHGLVMRLSALSNVLHGKLGRKGGWRALHHSIAPAEWRAEAMTALTAVRLTDKAEDRADQLSGGQAQRVAIARALIRKPRLFIADEPSASLDPTAGHEVMQNFADIAEQTKTTLVFTTHDMDHALSYARRVIALKNGRICLDAESRDLTTSDLEAVFHG